MILINEHMSHVLRSWIVFTEFELNLSVPSLLLTRYIHHVVTLTVDSLTLNVKYIPCHLAKLCIKFERKRSIHG